MADPIENALYGSTLQPIWAIPITKQVDTSNFPPNLIAATDATVYVNAGQDFLSQDRHQFLKNYPELGLYVEREKRLEEQIKLQESASTPAVLGVVKQNLADEIAAAKYPIIDHEKSLDMAAKFAGANTAEQREAAMQTYPQLADVFNLSDQLHEVGVKGDKTLKDLIVKGIIPQPDEVLERALAADGIKVAITVKEDHSPEPVDTALEH